MRSSQPGERRVYTRVQTEGLAVVRQRGRFVGAYDLGNMSVGGALLTGQQILRVGEQIQMTLHLSPSILTLDAKVVRRSTSRGYGVTFDGTALVLRAIDEHVRSRFPQ